MTAQPYTCETEEIESLREQNLSLARDRARLITALCYAVNSGERLSDWLRDHTGPSDGTLYMLTDWHHTREEQKSLIRELTA